MIYSQSKLLGIIMLVLSNAIFPVAILIFASGFFPYKPFLPGQNNLSEEFGNIPQSKFDKVIFMVVDALRRLKNRSYHLSANELTVSATSYIRMNHPSSSLTGMNLHGAIFLLANQRLHSLIRKGAAIPFTAHATSPTITMPRVKAITTGSIPSFLDVILNFAESDTTSSLANQDSWLTQLKARNGGKLLMYGDDTWLKLFPNVFARADGTSSFFVSLIFESQDFTEVDNNVTRHLSNELSEPDWDGYIMHYLGLDHIGHKSGPRSPHMLPKQKEMDGIVEIIYNHLLSRDHLQSTLLVLCGDHGMNDAGNHGGSAPGETSPALVFISPGFQRVSQGLECPVTAPQDEFQYFQIVEQSDIAPTLAGLLGIPIPLNNLGVLIPGILKLWPDENEKISLLRQNARQILRIVEATFPGIAFDKEPEIETCVDPTNDGDRLWCMWNHARKLSPRKEEPSLEYDALFEKIMSTAASNYDVNKLWAGVFLSAISAACALGATALTCKMNKSNGYWGAFLAFTYGMVMFASSFVEEEHHFWFWLSSAWLGWLCATKSTNSSQPHRLSFLAAAALLVSHRILRRWNQTGQKHAGEPDIARGFLPAHTMLLWTLIATAYAVFSYQLRPENSSSLGKMVFVIFASICCGCALVFKVSFTNADAPELLRAIPSRLINLIGHFNLIVQARVVFISIGLLLAVSLTQHILKDKDKKRPSDVPGILHNILSLFLITQTRTTNIPLFLIFFCQLRAMQIFNLNAIEVTLTSIMFQYCSFFALGGSNAISSIDLSSAYNGIDDYNVILVGVLTFLGNWAGPLWWATGAHCLSEDGNGKSKDFFRQHVCLLTFFAGSFLMSTMAACTLLRTHLFIWTVFSPKYLYTMAWTIGQHLGVNILVGYGFWASTSG